MVAGWKGVVQGGGVQPFAIFVVVYVSRCYRCKRALIRLIMITKVQSVRTLLRRQLFHWGLLLTSEEARRRVRGVGELRGGVEIGGDCG